MVRLRKFSSLMGDEMVIDEESDDEDASLAKQQGLTLILAVLLIGLVIFSGIGYLRKREEMVQV